MRALVLLRNGHGAMNPTCKEANERRMKTTWYRLLAASGGAITKFPKRKWSIQANRNLDGPSSSTSICWTKYIEWNFVTESYTATALLKTSMHVPVEIVSRWVNVFRAAIQHAPARCLIIHFLYYTPDHKALPKLKNRPTKIAAKTKWRTITSLTLSKSQTR